MWPFTITLPELEHLPLDRQKAILEDFNTSAAALRDRLGKLPFRLGAVLMMPVMGVMILVYDKGLWPCMFAGFLCFAVGVPIGIVYQMAVLRRALKQYVQENLSGKG